MTCLICIGERTDDIHVATVAHFIRLLHLCCFRPINMKVSFFYRMQISVRIHYSRKVESVDVLLIRSNVSSIQRMQLIQCKLGDK